MLEVKHKDFFEKDLPQFLQNLAANQAPRFGLMTAQHMVEHLLMTMKTSVKRYGEPEDPPTKGQVGFKAFITKGAPIEHRPSDKTKADLPELKYANLEEAINKMPEAVSRFYTHYEANPEFRCYNKFMGELGFDELELFHYQHFRFHLHQFHLLETFA